MITCFFVFFDLRIIEDAKVQNYKVGETTVFHSEVIDSPSNL